MSYRHFFVIIFTIILFLTVKNKQVFAVCGSFFAYLPQGQQCVDLDYSPINPSVVCTASVGICCSSSSECPGAGTPTPTLPPNSGYEESSESCGSIFFDANLGRQVCLDSQVKILSNAQNCPYERQCCRELANCSAFWSCNNGSFTCYEDPHGAYNSFDACSVDCQPTRAPDPTSTPQVLQPTVGPDDQYSPPVDSKFLFRVNPLTVTGNDNEKNGSFRGKLNLFFFQNPASSLNHLMPYLFSLAGMILFVMLVWGGFEMMRGAADTKAQEAGKNRITAALIGFGLLFISYWIAQIVQYIFGVNVLG